MRPRRNGTRHGFTVFGTHRQKAEEEQHDLFNVATDQDYEGVAVGNLRLTRPTDQQLNRAILANEIIVKPRF
jgi:hypothetical protein